MNTIEEFAARLTRTSSGCLVWSGARMPAGYGRVNWCGKVVYTVAQIRTSLAAGERHRVIAAQLGVARSTVSMIAAGVNWRENR